MKRRKPIACLRSACRRQTCGTRARPNSAAGRRGRRRSAYEAPRAAADRGTPLGGAESKRRRRPRLPAPPSRVTLLRGDQPARAPGAEGAGLGRAAVRGVAGGRIVEADRHLERALLWGLELHVPADGPQANAAVTTHLHGEVVDALGARYQVLVVPELEGAVHAHELVVGDLGAQHLRPAGGPDLEEDVLLERVHAGETGLGEGRLEAQPAGGGAWPELAPRHRHGEALHAGAAGGILEVGEAVAVVVDAIGADLAQARGRDRGGGGGAAAEVDRAVGPAAQEGAVHRAAPGAVGVPEVAAVALLLADRVDVAIAAQRGAVRGVVVV